MCDESVNFSTLAPRVLKCVIDVCKDNYLWAVVALSTLTVITDFYRYLFFGVIFCIDNTSITSDS